jgi:asparagine synthase (glutamine-hydrolysing)
MANGIEPRCPFLDRAVKSISDQMTFPQLYSDNLNKIILRKTFEGALPQKIISRKKVSCDVGSGIRSMVVRYLKRNGRSEREELLEIWKQYFSFEPSQSYFHTYPVFDAAIDARGEIHR